MVKVVKRYQAHDGTEFDTVEGAKIHNELHAFDALIALTDDDIADILSRRNKQLGDLVEKFAHRVATKRRKEGDLKRAGKAEKAPETAPTTAPSPVADVELEGYPI